MNHLRHILILLFATVLVLGGCQKEEKIVVDLPPVKIITDLPQEVSSTQLVFVGQILQLNEEKVIEHGFVLTSRAGQETVIRLTAAATPGYIKHTYKPSRTFSPNETFSYYYYLKTEKDTYKGQSHHFFINEIKVDGERDIQATPGEQVVLRGNFKQLDESFSLRLSQPIDQAVSYVTDEAGTSLTFTMPRNLTGYLNPVGLLLVQNQQVVSMLASIQILGVLFPPAAGTHYYTQPIKLTGDGLPPFYLSTVFKVIIGDKLLDYAATYEPYTLRLRGDKIRLGYYNGRDTVIFDEPWRLIPPDASAITFSPEVVHPGSVTYAEGINFYDHFVYQISETLVGTTSTISAAYDASRQEVYVPHVPEGEYPLTLKSPMYGSVVSTKKLKVQKLKISSIDAGTGYFHDPIVIKGNFLPDEEYVVRRGEWDLFYGKASQGEIRFDLPTTALGTGKLAIGYRVPGDTYIVHESSEIEIKGVSIDSFYPKSGYPGDIITVKGKGLKINHYLFSMGGSGASIIAVADGEYKIMVPVTLRKGPTRITISYDGYPVQSEEYFTIL